MATRFAKPPSVGRRWGFRIAAVLCGLSVFLVFELVCWGFDWGRPDHSEDPFVGFHAVRPLFVIDEQGESGSPSERYHIPVSRRRYFAPESFPVVKTPGTFRIFCLGGSTVNGQPFSKETSFTTWLRLALEAAVPSRRWDVVNCGGVSYASYRLVPILQECLNYEPDLFVICTGHNEFLEDRTYARIKAMPVPIVRLHRALAPLRSYTLFRSALVALGLNRDLQTSRDRPMLKTDVDALLDHRGGLEVYHRDDTWHDGVVAHFGTNLRRMIATAHDANVPALGPCGQIMYPEVGFLNRTWRCGVIADWFMDGIIIMSKQITDELVESIRLAARKLGGYRRREFQAEMALKYCDGSARKAERLFGWRRDAVETGLNERRTGIRCLDNTSARGRKKTEEKCPQIVEKIKGLVEPHSQADPTFRTTLAYTKITAARVRAELLKDRSVADAVPSRQTVGEILNRQGYRLRRPQKTRPEKKFPKQTRSLRTSMPPVEESLRKWTH